MSGKMYLLSDYTNVIKNTDMKTWYCSKYFKNILTLMSHFIHFIYSPSVAMMADLENKKALHKEKTISQ